MNVEKFLIMLREEIWPAISTLENIEDLIFMQDGTTPHFALVVREWPNAHIPRRWIGRDFIPCDFPSLVFVVGASLLYQTNDLGRT